MELLLQSFVFGHYGNLGFQVPMNGSIPKIWGANESEAGKITPRQVQPEACRKDRRGNNKMPQAAVSPRVNATHQTAGTTKIRTQSKPLKDHRIVGIGRDL